MRIEQHLKNLVIVLCVLFCGAFAKVKKVHFSYPTELLPPITGTYFSATVTHGKLTCFGNRDYVAPTYFYTLLCMLPYLPNVDCSGVWGSRSVLVETTGSVEFLKLVNGLPQESVRGEIVPINATRWLDVSTYSSESAFREIIQVHAEPIYLCARSNDWRGGPSQFSITFRDAHVRHRDKRDCHDKTVLLLVVILALSSTWLLPYVVAMAAAVLTYLHGIKIILVLVAFSTFVVCLTPLMLTRKNRYLARLYLNYFFTRIEAEDTKMVIRLHLPAFQALYFSCGLICAGSLFSYLLYHFNGIDRELRNMLLKMVLSAAVSWFVFFVGRSFEQFLRDWAWIPMCVGLAQMLDSHLNPLSRDKVVVATMVLSRTLLFGLSVVVKQDAVQSLENRALAPLVVVANLLGIRLSDSTKKRHHHHHGHHGHRLVKSITHTSITDSAHKSSPTTGRRPKSGHRFKGERSDSPGLHAALDMSVLDSDTAAGEVHSRPNSLWRQLNDDPDPSEAGASDEELNRLALERRGIRLLVPPLSKEMHRGVAAGCLVGGIVAPLFAVGPLRFFSNANTPCDLLLPLVSTDEALVLAVQRTVDSLSQSEFSVTFGAPVKKSHEVTVVVSFNSAAAAHDFLTWSADDKNMQVMRAVVTADETRLGRESDFTVTAVQRGCVGEVCLVLSVSTVDLTQRNSSISLLHDCAVDAIVRLISALCEQFGCRVNTADFLRSCNATRLALSSEDRACVTLPLTALQLTALGFESISHIMWLMALHDAHVEAFMGAVVTGVARSLGTSHLHSAAEDKVRLRISFGEGKPCATIHIPLCGVDPVRGETTCAAGVSVLCGGEVGSEETLGEALAVVVVVAYVSALSDRAKQHTARALWRLAAADQQHG